MGRYYFNKKDTTDDCRSLDVAWLKKYGYFCGWKNGGMKWSNSFGNESSIGFIVSIEDSNDMFLKFNYTITDRDTEEKESFDYKVQLTTTPCNYGGVRYWFICPLANKEGVGCNRRVGTLYQPPGFKYFGCRHCYKLTYDSRNRRISSRYPEIDYLYEHDKLEKYKEKIGITHRKGEPTKKFRKYMQKAEKLLHLSRNFKK